MNSRWWLWGIIAIWGCFVWLGMVRLDPDYGWHVRMGEYIVNHGIPKTDPFSYTMANFPFVDHEWLTNLGMYWGDRWLGKTGMALLAATIVVGAVFLALPGKWRKWCAVPILLVYSIWWPRAGVRPQIEDWLILPLVIRLVGEDDKWKKWKWGLPLVMELWANLHGGFVVGLAIVGTVLLVKNVENRKLNIGDWLVFGVAGLATLVNPYGIRLWGEVWQQLSDRKVGQIIAEWQPIFTQVELGWIFLVAWTGVLGYRYWKKVEKWKLVIVVGTFVASVFSLRHGAIFAIVSLPVACEYMNMFIEEYKHDKVALTRLTLFYRWLMVITAVIFIGGVFVTILNPRNKMAENFFYPQKAVENLKNKAMKGTLYTDYGWGGYVIWKLPEYKIFIDGRMATWKWKSPDSGYSDYAFNEYLDINFRNKWQEWFEKYEVGTVLMPVGRTWPLRQWLTEKFKIIGINFFIPDGQAGLVDELIKNGWNRVYTDEVSVILERP